jgi:hypothetical protein
MRTGLFLLSGFLLLGALFLLAKLFVANFPNAPNIATVAFLLGWLLITAFNLWVGVSRAGYAASEELPILLLLYGVPAAAALLLRWKVL